MYCRVQACGGIGTFGAFQAVHLNSPISSSLIRFADAGRPSNLAVLRCRPRAYALETEVLLTTKRSLLEAQATDVASLRRLFV